MKAEFKPVIQRHDKVLIIGGGESLIGFDFNRLKGFDGVIVTVNNVINHLPRVDYWITVDPMSNGSPQQAMVNRKEGIYYFCAYPREDDEHYQTVQGVHYLERIVPEDKEGLIENYMLQEDKDKITTGDSCYGALGLAYHFEASKIILLGIDGYGYGHWYDKSDPYNKGWGEKFDNYLSRIPLIYSNSVRQFEDRGCKVVNGSPESKIDCFERMSPEKAFNYFN